MYCTTDQVRGVNELLEDAANFPDEKITPWIAKAQSRIDTVLSKRYVAPLTGPIPPAIESVNQDMAAGLFILNSFSNHLSQELINLANQYIKRADADLAFVVENKLLDGLPGIMLKSSPAASSTPAIASTTGKKTSPVEEIIKQW